MLPDVCEAAILPRPTPDLWSGSNDNDNTNEMNMFTYSTTVRLLCIAEASREANGWAAMLMLLFVRMYKHKTIRNLRCFILDASKVSTNHEPRRCVCFASLQPAAENTRLRLAYEAWLVTTPALFIPGSTRHDRQQALFDSETTLQRGCFGVSAGQHRIWRHMEFHVFADKCWIPCEKQHGWNYHLVLFKQNPVWEKLLTYYNIKVSKCWHMKDYKQYTCV